MLILRHPLHDNAMYRRSSPGGDHGAVCLKNVISLSLSVSLLQRMT